MQHTYAVLDSDLHHGSCVFDRHYMSQTTSVFDETYRERTTRYGLQLPMIETHTRGFKLVFGFPEGLEKTVKYLLCYFKIWRVPSERASKVVYMVKISV